MPKLLRTVGSAVRDILYVPPPSAQYLERTRHSTVVPWYVRLFGSSPWQKRARNLILGLSVLVIGGSIASVFYTRNADAEERRFAAGVAAIRNSDYKTAKAILQRTTQSDPTNAQAFYELGNARWMLGEGEEAAAAWTSALQIDPTIAPAFIARGIQKFNTGDIEGSLDDFDKATRLQPTMEAHLQKGMALQRLARHEEAVAAFEDALRYANTDDRREIDVASKASRRALKAAKVQTAKSNRRKKRR